jgi:thiol-disulfide isomerase/thioredoxin
MEEEMNKKVLFTLISMVFIIAACSPAVPTEEAMMEKPTDAMMEKATDDMMDTPTEVTEAMATEEMEDKDMMTPGFFDVLLTDVNTGESFKISDYAGKVVLVENLAMWCSNCKKQQDQVKVLHELLGMDSDLVSIGLDVDPNEKAEDLKKYIEGNGFDWIYVIPPQEVLQEIGNLYGANFLNPPNTPILIIDRKGQVHPMPFGVKSADELKAFIDPFLAEGM